MEQTLTREAVLRRDKRIIFICWLAYAMAYVGRLNFSASIVAIISDLGVTKAQAGLVSSCFFFAYGAGQLVNGVLSKHYNSKLMIALSLGISSMLNLAMAFCSDIAIMKYIWLENGMVQSVLWSTLIKTISELVSEEMMPRAILVMSTTSVAGTFFAYGFSALFVKLGNWRGMFAFATVVLLVTAGIWLALFGPSHKPTQVETAESGRRGKLGAVMAMTIAITCLCGIVNGFVKDGVNTWVTSVLYEEFGVSQSFSIMLTLLLPLVATFGAMLVKKIHSVIISHSMMNMLFFIASALLCGGILLSLKLHSIVMIMVCFIGVSCTMAMINNVITSVFPLDIRRLMNAGFAAGLLNTFCYVGSTTASYSLGALSQSRGWSPVFLLMLGVCAVAAVICAVSLAVNKKHG